MVLHSYFTKNIDSNPKTSYQFHHNVPSFQFNFPNEKKMKYMTIVDHENNINVQLNSYVCSFPPIYIPLNNSQN